MNAVTIAPRSRLLLTVTMLVFAANTLDRQILGIALPGIRADFHLSDSALGLLAGPAFALVYVLLGIPMAVLADRGHARRIVAGSLGLFSVMTLLCGMAGSFAALLAARFGVGVGEAGTAPALSAMITARVRPEKRTGAFSVYAAGANLGLLLAFFGGGLVMQHWGWRAALTCAGIPGLLLILPFLAVTRDAPKTAAGRAPLRQTIRFLWRQKTFRLLALGSGLTSIGGYAALAFLPSFLGRTHHLNHAQIGLLLAGLTGVLGFFGTMLPGLLADHLKRDGLWMAVITLLATLPFHALMYLSGDLRLVIPALAVAACLASSWLGPVFAAAQALAPGPMRAQTAALLLAALNLIGLAAGPFLVGALSDALRPALGEESLRYALLCSIVPSAAALWCFAAARRRIAAEAP